MSGNPYDYPQEGQMFQQPAKKRKHRFLKVIAILLVITVLSMSVVNYFVEPFFVSRLTKGFIFGFRTAKVKADDLADAKNIDKPTDKDLKAFSKFAKNLSNRIYLSLSSEDKEDFQEIKDGAKKLAALKRKIQSGQNPVEEYLVASSLTEEEKPPEGINSTLYLGLASAAVSISSTSLIRTEKANDEDDEKLFDPQTLNQISSLLYANGYPDLAAAVSSMAAAVYPDDPMSVLTFATILREGNADEDAFNVLQYALRLDPDSEPILYSLGMCALDLGDTSYAEACFSKILSLNAASGPGHQGMMLCYMDTGSYSSAFLHMIEGAREGYTSMVTETYKALRKKPNEYKDIAKPILDQYTFEQLLDFSKSRTPFDPTLDTPEGQLTISREINLGRNSASVYGASDRVLNEGLQYAMTALSHANISISDVMGMIPSEELGDLIGGLAGLLGQGAAEAPDKILEPASKSILDRIFGAAARGTTVSFDGWLNISYEAEAFWFSILNDYVQFKLNDLIEDYFEKAYNKIKDDPSSVIPSLEEYFETFNMLAGSNPIQAGAMALRNMVYNNSAVDRGTQAANQQDMDKFLQTVNPLLEEGYKKTADLMELYWLHSGSILGQIGDDETYNRFQQQRKSIVASALTPYVAAGTINSFFVTMNLAVVGPGPGGSGGGVQLPPFPNFPGTQMGKPYTPPPSPSPAPKDDPGVDEPPAEGPVREETASGQQQETQDAGESPTVGQPPSGPEKPGVEETTTEEYTGSLFIGPLTITFNEKTGFEVDLTAIGSVNLRYNRQTGDITLFSGIGASLGAVTSGISGRLGIFATINPRTMEITSGTRIGAEGQLAGNGFGYEKDVCFTTGADKTTVSKILGHKKTATTTSD